MKRLIFLTLFAAALAAHGQVAIKYDPVTSRRTEPTAYKIPTGKTDTYEAGSTLTISGVLSGTPSGGTLDLSNVTLTLPAGAGGDLEDFAADPSSNGSFSASSWRTGLALVIGTNVQAYDADLTTYAGITPAANVQSILSAADYSAIRTLLGLVIGTNVQAYDADLDDLADGSLSGSKVGSGISGDNISSGTVADARIASTLARDSEVTSAVSALSSVYQPLDSDLTTYAGITPSANVQSYLGAASYSAMRTLLGLVIGTNVQAYDADLTTYAAITPAANVQSLLGAADYSAMRTQLSLVIGTNVQAYDADLTTYAGITPAANVQSLLGAADYSAMRTQLGLVIGTNVQAYDGELAALAGLTSAANKLPYFSGSGTAALADLSAFGRSIIDDADAPALRVTTNIATQAIASTEIDWDLGPTHSKTLSANTTFTFSNDTDGEVVAVAITNTASNYTVTWPSGILWKGGVAPTQTTGAKTDVYFFSKIGSAILGAQDANYFAP